MMGHVPEPFVLAVLVPTALVASLVSGVAGFGAGIIMLPVIALTVGVRAAAPVLTVTMLLGNVGRIWWSRREMNLGVAARYLAGAVPGTFIGVVIYAGATGQSLGRAIGVFLLASLPFRRLLTSTRVRVRLAHFPLLGGVIGVISAVVVTTGPLSTPFFLAYGLRRGAFIATEGLCGLGMSIARSVGFARYSLLGWDTVALGCVLGSTMLAGSWIARRLLDRMSDRVFLLIIEAMLVVMGLQFLLFPGK